MDGFDRRQKQLSVERKERIRYVLVNKNRLTRVELAEHWGIKVQGVSDFLRKHGLPKLPKGVPDCLKGFLVKTVGVQQQTR